MNELMKAVEKHTEKILEAERYIWKNPETGYKEFKTSAYMEKSFEELGYDIIRADGITGFYTVIDTGRPGPQVLILAELDSVVCKEHPEADSETGAVHSCGHHAQCAALLGIAAALKEPGILDKFCGKIQLCAVPAEEMLEVEFRSSLKAEGKIKYLGGKCEFLSRGYFDDVDIAFMVHTNDRAFVRNGGVGFITKQVKYKGKAAHAGCSPWDGNNALYAATCGINAVNAIRETFRDSDIIRVHPIITNGGAIVNAIPSEASLECYVRGLSFEAMKQANERVNRALCGAALSLGTNIDIIDIPGYSPLINDTNLIEMLQEAANETIPGHGFCYLDAYSSGSTDMGDLSQIMPVVHPYIGGAEGTDHGSDYKIADPVTACVGSAKLQLGLLYLLLSGDGKRAKKVISEYKATFGSKEEFLEFVDSIWCSGDRILYEGDSATVKL